MKNILITALLLLVTGGCAATGGLADAVKEAARSTAEREAAERTAAAVTTGFDRAEDVVVCLVTDRACIERAEEEGRSVTLKDEDGNTVMTGDASTAAAVASRPGEGAWVNYDFQPGDRVLFASDFSGDRIGDFPRRLEFKSGNMEVVKWQGEPLLRSTSNNSVLIIPLPKTLPERFTVELDLHLRAPNYTGYLTTETFPDGRVAFYQYPYIWMGGEEVGIRKGRDRAATKTRALTEGDRMKTLRLMVDGDYAKVYVDEQRVANMPNAGLRRGDAIQIGLPGDGQQPSLLGDIRIAAGGADLYHRLKRDGRVATQGIYFDTGSDRIRPESTATLEEIIGMLEDHPDLSLVIEGHTDPVGDEAANLDLSQRRAEAVRTFLVREAGIEPGRLEARGMGEQEPVADSDTAEGRQQNRRVELVRVR